MRDTSGHETSRSVDYEASGHDGNGRQQGGTVGRVAKISRAVTDSVIADADAWNQRNCAAAVIFTYLRTCSTYCTAVRI